jgi:hypothetical protein
MRNFTSVLCTRNRTPGTAPRSLIWQKPQQINNPSQARQVLILPVNTFVQINAWCDGRQCEIVIHELHVHMTLLYDGKHYMPL